MGMCAVDIPRLDGSVEGCKKAANIHLYKFILIATLKKKKKVERLNGEGRVVPTEEA